MSGGLSLRAGGVVSHYTIHTGGDSRSAGLGTGIWVILSRDMGSRRIGGVVHVSPRCEEVRMD